ncbi:protein DENND6A [Chrysoperla carnea]|uniref:protein DENND6A n=1 Tax=Chrysoperla carnea TaxID=189513 RepID=UPI001D0850B6|nr:protein DENND6A [Chrysoperla carnea]
MGENGPKNSATSNDKNFSSWIHCICVITFDLELGQVIESVHPKDAQITKQEMSNICYLAFPDSNSGCMGDTQFTVRLRRSPGQPDCSSSAYGRHASPPKQFLWGYVYFRQVKDITLPRGYFQKSVVVLSTLSHVGILGNVSAIVADAYFTGGMIALEETYRLSKQWPDPETISLQTPISLHLPGTKIDTTLSTETSIANSWLMPIAAHAQLLWELVLTAEPLIVFAANPTLCSQTVLALVGMISPLVYSGDYRPYFTIHDSEFKEFTSGLREAPAAILGVTNPFFSKTLQHWPHTIRLCETVGGHKSKKHIHDSNGGASLAEIGDVRTVYKPFLRADRSLSRRLRLGRRQAEAHTALLRRHLVELTQSFMIPLERYMASLMPLQKNVSPFKGSVTPLPFNPDKFFATLASSGPQLTSGVRGNWEGLYRKFLRSPNFNVWFNQRYTELSRQLHTLQLQALARVNLKQWVEGKAEVEVVDMVLNIRHKIARSSSDEETRDKLTQCLKELFEALPEDLRNILQVER